MKYRKGLKMFSDKLDYFRDDTIKYYTEGKFEYIELFVHPGHMEYLYGWEQLQNTCEIPFTMHAPHFSQGVNLADETMFDYNNSVYKQINTFAEALNVEYTVVHGGMNGTVEEIVRQIEKIKPYKMLIENKPYVSPRKPENECRGAKLEEIEYIKSHYDCGFCLDIGHSFCSAVSQNLEPMEYFKKFNALNPDAYHLSDGEINNPIDIHYHLSKGDYDWLEIFKIVDKSKNMTLETIKKNDQSGIELFLEDVAFVESF